MKYVSIRQNSDQVNLKSIWMYTEGKGVVAPALGKKNWNLSEICNCNRTECSPIRSVIIPVINKIGQRRSGSPICSSRVLELDVKMSRYQ